MSTYHVGQILFLIANNKVVPIQVIEEVVRTTLKGIEKTHIIKFPDKDETTIDIKKIKGLIFSSKEDVRKHMIDNATNAINKMISDADMICEEIFVISSEKTVNSFLPDKQEYEIDSQKMQLTENKNKIIKVDLGNGKIGNINTENLEKVGDV